MAALPNDLYLGLDIENAFGTTRRSDAHLEALACSTPTAQLQWNMWYGGRSRWYGYRSATNGNRRLWTWAYAKAAAAPSKTSRLHLHAPNAQQTVGSPKPCRTSLKPGYRSDSIGTTNAYASPAAPDGQCWKQSRTD